MQAALSPSERDYILAGVDQEMRADGRGRGDYRHVAIQTGFFEHTNGSARVTVPHGGTDVVAAVKAEIGAPDPNFPNCGRIEVSVECSNFASPEFRGRGASEVDAELSAMLARYHPNLQNLDDAWREHLSPFPC